MVASATARASVPVERLPLSSYRFPHLASGPQCSPLEGAVKEAVQHLDQAPFLQLHRGRACQRHGVDDSLLAQPQLWAGVAGYLRETATELVLLVHPLDQPEAARSSAAVPNSGEILTGITNASHRSRLHSFAELVRTGAATADFSGHVGECCDGEEHSQVVPFSRNHEDRRAHGRRRPHRHHRRHAGSEKAPAQYWGVVAQGKGAADAGCYVLKTCHSAVGDCTCIHWSLTRVCSGAPFFDQVSSAWLLG